LPLAQVPELQSVPAAHVAPVAQCGAHAGATHFPELQAPELQSSSLPHASPSRQVGAHFTGAIVTS
jgi:hypothetical protein